MKYFLASSVALAALLNACASAPSTAERAESCPAPNLVASHLIVGDGAMDRGFLGGVSLADVDGDGDLDLMATGGYSPVARPMAYRRNVLYLNDGAGNFTHADDPAWEAADNPFSGSAWGDVDHDGDLDAFISTQHGRPDVFYRNLGGGRFAREDLGDATTTAGSNFTSTWADVDQDGDLDLTAGGPTLEPGQPILHYRNDGGRFVRVTGVAIENGLSNPGAVIWADFDNDVDPDMLVANSDVQRRSAMDAAEFESTQLYRNDGAWSFARTEGQGFSDLAYAGATIATGDIDNDGDLDVYVGKFSGDDHIFLNDGSGQFTHDPRFASPSHEGWATGAAFVDLDSDGDLDLVNTGYEAGILVWRNDGSGVFALDEAPALRERVSTYSGSASGDIDGDGDLDIVLGDWGETEQGEFITILRNESAACGRPLRLVLSDRYGAPDPIGARVTLVTRGRGGERVQLREAAGQSTMRSQSASHFLFSVPNGERVVRATIRWPNGETQELRGMRAGETRRVQQGG